jgi:adenylate cyclase
MAGEHVERRLAAILAVDAVGYSRMMQADEEATLAALKAHRRDRIDPAITTHGGRIFKTTGDGLLAEFTSVLNAARCAVDIQTAMMAANADLPVDRRITLRIGLNLGDIIVDGDDVHGDGVNLAARLEGLAEPGGIACSAAFRQQVGTRAGLTFHDRGEHAVKNMQPVHVFFLEPAATSPHVVNPDRPTIAVLPFANMSNDPEQEFFSDGITEDIITDLSRVSGLAVVSRNTAFSFKGKSLNLQQIARQLGVGWLVEGSVRRAGNRVRITAQLIDGTTDRHLWAERYDRDLTDIFAVQDEITTAIVAQLKVRLLPAEKAAIEKAATGNVEAYAFYLKGRQHFWVQTKADLELARRMFARATELDPAYARAWAGMVDCDSYLCFAHGVDIPLEAILANADKAIMIDPGLAEAHAARGGILGDAGRKAEAIAEFEQALALDPNNFETLSLYGEFCLTHGNPAQSARHYTRATDIQPDGHRAPMMLRMVLDALGRHDEARHFALIALQRAERERGLRPDSTDPLLSGATVLAALGRRQEALEWLAMAQLIDPDDRRTSYNAAVTLALLGEADQAIDQLEISVAKSGTGIWPWIRVDADFNSVREHPRFLALMARA